MGRLHINDEALPSVVASNPSSARSLFENREFGTNKARKVPWSISYNIDFDPLHGLR